MVTFTLVAFIILVTAAVAIDINCGDKKGRDGRSYHVVHTFVCGSIVAFAVVTISILNRLCGEKIYAAWLDCYTWACAHQLLASLILALPHVIILYIAVHYADDLTWGIAIIAALTFSICMQAIWQDFWAVVIGAIGAILMTLVFQWIEAFS